MYPKMWDILFWRHTFFNKCKSQLKMANLRIEAIRRRRKAMQKYLRNDIADLLKSNLADNAYGRAEGLCLELTLSWCYDYVEHCCNCVLNHLKSVQKESECPKECRVAVASLMYAAARFADLPDLRNLRDLFTDKYGNSLDSYVDMEFAENLRPPTPSMMKKLQLMRDIAEEYSVDWNSTSFEQKLRSGSAAPEQQQVEQVGSRSSTSESDDMSLETATEHLKSETDYEDFSDLVLQHSPAAAENDLEHKAATDRHTGSGTDHPHDESDEDAIRRRLRLFTDGIVPPPYTKSSKDAAGIGFLGNELEKNHRSESEVQAGRDGEEELQESSTHNSESTKTEPPLLPLPPARRPLYFPESRRLSTQYRANNNSDNSTVNKRHVRTFSLGSDRIMNDSTRNTSERRFFVHPKLPDYEDLALRMLSLRH